MTKPVRPTQHNSTIPARTQPIARSSRSLRSAGTPNPVNAKRKKKSFNRAYGGKWYRAFVVALPCTACKAPSTVEHPSDPAHTKGGGAGRKADANTLIPLCRRCHMAQHAHGWTLLELEFGFDRTEAAKETQRAWLAHTGDAG